MSSLFVFIRKDLRLLARDRAALIFILLAPLIVICVAGFSLANLYGADPTGQTAYDLPFLDEDGSSLSQQIRERLMHEPAVRLQEVHSRGEAQATVRDKRAGTALIVPHGTAEALANGESAKLILYNDPIKYLERINLRTRILEIRDAIAAEQRVDVQRQLASERSQAEEKIAALKSTAEAERAKLDAAWKAAKQRRAEAVDKLRREAADARTQGMKTVNDSLRRQLTDVRSDIHGQIEHLRDEFRAYVDTLSRAQADFEVWLSDLKRRAGSHAADIPVPPSFPELPTRLKQIIDGTRPPFEFPTTNLEVALPQVALPDLPPVPEIPDIEIPDVVLPPIPTGSSSLDIEVVSLSGGPTHINTFDQNVPGFAVTFLMLGMLLGISLGLLDEREWGTFDRMRALPVGPAHFMLAKLITRFLVGVVQMILLLSIGWMVFGVSLGPQPAALLLPICGIAFAGTAFGLIVAAVAHSREAVFSVGSVVMVTMAAVGGCWWPIDLEPRWMRSVALAFPTTWAMDAFNDLMIRRRTFEAGLAPTAVLIAYGLLYLIVALVMLRRRG